MQRGAVALVLRKSVFREFAVEVEHESIARDFCNDAGGSYGKAEPVSTNESSLFDGEVANRQSINQNMIGGRCQLSRGCPHCFVRRTKNVQLVDLLMTNN